MLTQVQNVDTCFRFLVSLQNDWKRSHFALQDENNGQLKHKLRAGNFIMFLKTNLDYYPKLP